MTSSLYTLVFAKKLSQRKIEHIIDALLIKHGMQVDCKRERFPKQGCMPAYSEITYNSWAIENLITVKIPEVPQSKKGYTVPVVFTYYGSSGGLTTSAYLASIGKKSPPSSKEILEALRKVCYKKPQ